MMSSKTSLGVTDTENKQSAMTVVNGNRSTNIM